MKKQGQTDDKERRQGPGIARNIYVTHVQDGEQQSKYEVKANSSQGRASSSREDGNRGGQAQTSEVFGVKSGKFIRCTIESTPNVILRSGKRAETRRQTAASPMPTANELRVGETDIRQRHRRKTSSFVILSRTVRLFGCIIDKYTGKNKSTRCYTETIYILSRQTKRWYHKQTSNNQSKRDSMARHLQTSG